MNADRHHPGHLRRCDPGDTARAGPFGRVRNVAEHRTGPRRRLVLDARGLETDALLHVGVAAVGLAAVLASSQNAYAVIQYGGAAYLLYLGVRQLRTLVDSGTTPDVTGRAPRLRLYRDGVLVDLLNPKTALFFLAFLPQFVEPARGPESGQIATLGLCFVALAVVCDGGYAIIAGGLGRRLRSSVRAQAHINRVTGCMYVGLAGLAAFA